VTLRLEVERAGRGRIERRASNGGSESRGVRDVERFERELLESPVSSQVEKNLLQPGLERQLAQPKRSDHQHPERFLAAQEIADPLQGVPVGPLNVVDEEQ
jgi:hypothetical protein